jgi:hypothetical protein
VRGRWAGLLGWPAVLAVGLGLSLVFRVYALGRLPGINGDEAWYGVQVLRFLAGEAVDWRTPTGNLPGPLHAGMLLGIQRFLDPSLVVLRLPSLIASLLQLGLTYVVVRRHFDRPTGVLALVLTAVLPVNIAYARFGWDPSHSGLVAIIAAYFALAGNPWGSALAFTLALAVHPTNVFLAPFLVIAFLGADWHRRGKWRVLARSGLHVGLLVAALGLLSRTTSGGRASVAWPDVVHRLTTPAEWGLFARLFSRLLTGDTVYAYIAGSGLGEAQVPADVALALILLGLLGLGAWRLRKELWGAVPGVVVGWLASVVAFFLIAGNGSIQPHQERYALCLLVPTVLAVSVLLRELGERGARLWRPYALTTAVAALLLLSFHLRYFRFIEATGSTSHETFWTGAAEPKGAAFERILAEAGGKGGARVVAESWWVYWPLAYLAWGKPLDVVWLGPVPAASGRPGGTYWVGFPGAAIDQAFRGQGIGGRSFDIPGAGRPAALRVWWTPEPGAAP